MPSEKVLLAKQQLVADLTEKIKAAPAGVLVNYIGINVENDTKLRRELREANVEYTVVKNTLAKIAVKGTEYEVLTEKLTGPIALAFGFNDPVSPAKAVSKFIKDTKKGVIIGAALDGKLLTEAETKALAELPSKEELYAKMLGCVNSPATGIVGSINAVMASLTRAIAAVRDQKAA